MGLGQPASVIHVLYKYTDKRLQFWKDNLDGLYQLYEHKYLGADHDIGNLYETRYKIVRTEIGSLFETPDPDPKLLDP